MQEFDCIVIGGGIVGLSVAWTIAEKKPHTRIAVLEKEDGWARHQTGRNSGVIHSGIYYKPGSLKAKLCREGNRRMVEFCDHYGIPQEACGKVIVATRTSEIPLLEKLFERGVANELEVRKLSTEQVLELEPHVQCLAGIHVPSTGIVDYAAVCRKLAELVAAGGGRITVGHQGPGVSTERSESRLGDFKWAIVGPLDYQLRRLAQRPGGETGSG